MDLKEYCTSLAKDKRLELALRLCDKAHPIWENYYITGNLSYRDTTVGELHKVEKNLLNDALIEKFLEPITAIQDDDWILPYPVERTFYAIYNLIKGFKQEENEFGELLHYLSVNQAVDAIWKSKLMSVDEIKNCIYGSY
jgi:hypothetical protein